MVIQTWGHNFMVFLVRRFYFNELKSGWPHVKIEGEGKEKIKFGELVRNTTLKERR
jgi:hypothetical protein